MYIAFGERLVKSFVTTDNSQNSTEQVARINDAVDESVSYFRGHIGSLYDMTVDSSTWDATLRRAICNRAMYSIANTRPARDQTLNAKSYLEMSEKVRIDIMKGDLKLALFAQFKTGAEVVGDDIIDGVYTGDTILELLGFEWSWEDYCVLC